MRGLAFGMAAALLLAVPGAAQVGDVTVGKTVEADATTTMVHEVLVDATPAEVWAAISTAEGWMTWAVPVARIVDGDADLIESSYDPASEPGGPDTIQQRFGERVAGKRLAFRTVKAPAGFPHWDEYRQVGSVFEIEAAGEQTRVRLTSRGYPGSDGGRALVGFFEGGNALALGNLRQRFATGPIDWAAQRP
ncbi:SRPBCC domain-containing protein [Sphingopyxis sp. PET50]|uniref:SRPBCC family protein n=1 Tax=Sphingopyxis sp. PET50 TaxID=2976533 RepID=UPI0021AFA17F|nr:SRPBCC domain-containing protein [Sphingopyxis sp. PET50]